MDSEKVHENVDSFLKALKRPATSYEIVIAMRSKKNEGSVYSEIRSLLKNGTLKKLSVLCEGYDGEIILYIRKYTRKKKQIYRRR